VLEHFGVQARYTNREGRIQRASDLGQLLTSRTGNDHDNIDSTGNLDVRVT
jgi:hypothetical protein